MATGSFVLSAWIMGDRWQHHRTRDHFGPENATYVVCDAPIGRFPPGTPVPVILDDMFSRLSRLESVDIKRGTFTVDAFIAASGTYGHGLFWMDSVVKGTQTGSFAIDATITAGGSFTMDAYIAGRFFLDAFIV